MVGWGGGLCDYCVSPSPFGLDFGTLDFGTSGLGLTIAHVKKVCNLAESLDNTHELREKIKQYLEIPENDIESYVAHAKIEDENNDEEVRFVIIFTTKRILRYMKQSNNIHLDCTYRLNWTKFPVCVAGTSNVTGLFFPTMTILTSHEDTRALIEIYSFVHSEGIHPRFRMGDGAPASVGPNYSNYSTIRIVRTE